MPNKVPFSKVPFSDLRDAPDGKWVQGIVGGLNESMLALSGGPQNFQIKTLDITVPDPWIAPTQQNAWLGKGGLVYYMRHYDGSCQIRGYVTGGVYGTTAFTLPAALWPPAAMSIPAIAGGALGSWTINASNGACIPTIGAGTINIAVRFMPANNRPSPLKCFPMNVKTRFRKPPKAVVCLKNERVGQTSDKPTCTAGLPSWRFLNASQGPVVQVTDIPGLEYGCRQRVTVAIIGG